jgi:uncharacterized membrane protein YqgA involved in biofilm formation
LWGTIVNAMAVILGGLLGVLIRNGFSKKVRLVGLAVLAAVAGPLSIIGLLTDYINPLLVITGSIAACLLWLGLCWLLRNGLPEAYSNIIMQGIGLAVVIIGVSNSLETQNMLLVIISLVIGGIIGQALGIEKKLNTLGQIAQKKMSGGENSTIAQGFVTASLIFCVGAMAIVGALDSGIKGDHVTLYAKSMLDGITSIVLASALGAGVLLSAAAVFVYQGAITLASGAVAPFLSDMVIDEMTAVGGVLIIGIGLSMLKIRDFNIGNLLPAILIPPFYFSLIPWMGRLLEWLS